MENTIFATIMGGYIFVFGLTLIVVQLIKDYKEYKAEKRNLEQRLTDLKQLNQLVKAVQIGYALEQKNATMIPTEQKEGNESKL